MTIEDRLFLIATLGAHSNFADRGFRQRDIRFLLELFSNWTDVFLKPATPHWHNTQVSRFVKKLESEGLVRCKRVQKREYYFLTRLGLLSLIQKLVEINGFAEIRQISLVYYFLSSYRSRMIELIEREGSGFSKAVQLEIEHLFDHKRFLKQHIEATEQQIQRMNLRIKDTQSACQLAEKLHRQEEPIRAIIEKVSEQFPYELETQKPMHELFKEIEPKHQIWELTTGGKARTQNLWNVQLRILQSHLEILKSL